MDKKRWRKLLVGELSWKRVARSIVFVYVCLLVFALVWSDRLIFQPQPSSYTDAPELFKVNTADGQTMTAVYLVDPQAHYTILYNHANAVDLGDVAHLLVAYRDLGVSVFAYDYRGYGTSEGRPTTKRALADADAALKHLVEIEGVPLERIIIHGHSVGGGPAVHLASRNEVAGLILDSAFVSAYRVITRLPLFPFDKFRNLALIDKIDCPLLVIHGRDDKVVPFWHGQKLLAKAKEPKMNCWLAVATHNLRTEESQDAYWAAIESFIDQLDAPSPPGGDDSMPE
ncbi:alpha/beta hydrolase [Candidatus Sumerlaeota bacterium]